MIVRYYTFNNVSAELSRLLYWLLKDSLWTIVIVATVLQGSEFCGSMHWSLRYCSWPRCTHTTHLCTYIQHDRKKLDNILKNLIYDYQNIIDWFSNSHSRTCMIASSPPCFLCVFFRFTNSRFLLLSFFVWCSCFSLSIGVNISAFNLWWLAAHIFVRCFFITFLYLHFLEGFFLFLNLFQPALQRLLMAFVFNR